VKALIRADASSTIGMGHRVRCEALADELRRRGWDVTFCVSSSEHYYKSTCDKLLASETEFFEKASEADLAIVDHYAYDAIAFHELFTYQSNVLTVDDCNDRGMLDCRWLVNPVTTHYRDADFTCMSGPQYALLRRQFAEQRVHLLPFSRREKLVLAFGGTDPAGLTLPVLKSLGKTGFCLSHIKVMIGEGVSERQEISAFCREHGVELGTSVENVAGFLSNARLAISAAGGSLFELACMGVPAVFVPVADNQFGALRQHVEAGWCQEANASYSDVEALVTQAIELWQDEATLEQYHLRALKLVDGKGVERVIDKIENDLAIEPHTARVVAR